MNSEPEETRPVNIIRIKNDVPSEFEDTVIAEKNYTLFVNDSEIVTFLCSPVNLKELSIGFLCAEGFINSMQDLNDLTFNNYDGLIWAETTTTPPSGFLKRSVASCCGRARASFYFSNDAENIVPVNGEVKISVPELHILGRKLEESGKLFHQTGGTHGAALCLPEEIVCFFEDVGRHNTLDKIFGFCLQKEIPRKDKLILFTGRLSSEIVIKTARMGVSLIASLGAPTDLAIELARQLNITVIGFLRENRMNIYTYPERIDY